jgi:hypothetical protein
MGVMAQPVSSHLDTGCMVSCSMTHEGYLSK